MPVLPNIDYAVLSSLFAIVLTALFASWSVNKAILLFKSH